MRFHKGFTLLSLMIGVSTGAVLLLTIGQLSSISRANFLKNQNTVQIYVDARNAVELLRRYVPMAGVGIEQPTSAQSSSSSSSSGLMQYSASASYTPTLSPGGQAVLRDWVFVGMCLDPSLSGSSSFSYTSSIADPNQPLWCASQVANTSANFMALQGNNCYYSASSWTFVQSSIYYKGLCCANPGNNGSTSCGNPTYPVYSCGASDDSGNRAAAMYQKLIQHVQVPTIDAAGGDTLVVNFSNRGPANMQSYDGTAITPDAATLLSYTFSVNNASATLQMTDAGSGTTYSVGNNVEYMAVLVGESDSIQSNVIAGMELPEMNRYVRFNAANLYPYRITAVRIALVVRSNDNILSAPPAGATTLTLMTGSNNVPITYTPPLDRRLHKVFVSTIYLHSYALPEFRMNCTPFLPASGSSTQLQTGGIPFTTNAVTANDQCCGGSCTSYSGYNACEIQRMTNGC